jgi:hypothetical protein
LPGDFKGDYGETATNIFRKPDIDAFDIEHRRGAWSVFKDISFDEHLKRLKNYVDGKSGYEPRWHF